MQNMATWALFMLITLVLLSDAWLIYSKIRLPNTGTATHFLERKTTVPLKSELRDALHDL